MLSFLKQKRGLLSAAVLLICFLAFAGISTVSAETNPLDPFNAPPKGSSPNCGPERRLKVDIIVSSKDKFIEVLRNINTYVTENGIRHWVRFDNFRDKDTKEVNWKAVKKVIRISSLAGRTIYSVDFTPHGCSSSQKFTIKITNDGYISLYGCCGK